MKKSKFNLLALFIIALLTFSSKVVYGATVSINYWWDLVDSGAHLDWDGSTKYQTNFSAGVTTWENYKSGVIRKDTAYTLSDVTLSDYNSVDGYAALTYQYGAIKFNTYYMDSYNTNKRQFVTTHELGHALGLDHNTVNDIMYAYVCEKTSLSENDKASYDSAYTRYKLDW